MQGSGGLADYGSPDSHLSDSVALSSSNHSRPLSSLPITSTLTKETHSSSRPDVDALPQKVYEVGGYSKRDKMLDDREDGEFSVADELSLARRNHSGPTSSGVLQSHRVSVDKEDAHRYRSSLSRSPPPGRTRHDDSKSKNAVPAPTARTHPLPQKPLSSQLTSDSGVSSIQEHSPTLPPKGDDVDQQATTPRNGNCEKPTEKDMGDDGFGSNLTDQSASSKAKAHIERDNIRSGSQNRYDAQRKWDMDTDRRQVRRKDNNYEPENTEHGSQNCVSSTGSGGHRERDRDVEAPEWKRKQDYERDRRDRRRNSPPHIPRYSDRPRESRENHHEERTSKRDRNGTHSSPQARRPQMHAGLDYAGDTYSSDYMPRPRDREPYPMDRSNKGGRSTVDRYQPMYDQPSHDSRGESYYQPGQSSNIPYRNGGRGHHSAISPRSPLYRDYRDDRNDRVEHKEREERGQREYRHNRHEEHRDIRRRPSDSDLSHGPSLGAHYLQESEPSRPSKTDRYGASGGRSQHSQHNYDQDHLKTDVYGANGSRSRHSQHDYDQDHRRYQDRQHRQEEEKADSLEEKPNRAESDADQYLYTASGSTRRTQSDFDRDPRPTKKIKQEAGAGEGRMDIKEERSPAPPSPTETPISTPPPPPEDADPPPKSPAPPPPIAQNLEPEFKRESSPQSLSSKPVTRAPTPNPNMHTATEEMDMDVIPQASTPSSPNVRPIIKLARRHLDPVEDEIRYGRRFKGVVRLKDFDRPSSEAGRKNATLGKGTFG